MIKIERIAENEGFYLNGEHLVKDMPYENRAPGYTMCTNKDSGNVDAVLNGTLVEPDMKEFPRYLCGHLGARIDTGSSTRPANRA